ncbi:hypothetical protein BDV11DRAFT_194722 [Aspergillus similis]
MFIQTSTEQGRCRRLPSLEARPFCLHDSSSKEEDQRKQQSRKVIHPHRTGLVFRRDLTSRWLHRRLWSLAAVLVALCAVPPS